MVTLFGPEPEPGNDPAAGGVEWSELTRTSRHRCDKCVADAFRDYESRAAPIQRARWRRRHRGGEWLFCSEHAHETRLKERRP